MGTHDKNTHGRTSYPTQKLLDFGGESFKPPLKEAVVWLIFFAGSGMTGYAAGEHGRYLNSRCPCHHG